jgi:membrane protease subunit (stomatin/prohibitin family)
LAKNLDTIFNLPGQYEAISEGLIKKLEEDFSRFGIMLSNLYINSITPPPEVQKAIDDKSKLGIFDNLNKLLKMKAAMALENASQNPGQTGAGLGMGLGLMMPAMYSETIKNTPQAQETLKCLDCQNAIAADAKFCPACGQAVKDTQSPAICPHCKTENLPGAKYCNQCGEKI